jgi:hypothetical protein
MAAVAAFVRGASVKRNKPVKELVQEDDNPKVAGGPFEKFYRSSEDHSAIPSEVEESAFIGLTPRSRSSLPRGMTGEVVCRKWTHY